jgi:hypothetical protein
MLGENGGVMDARKRRWIGLILLLGCLPGLSQAQEKKQLSAAMAAVVANLDTDAGKQYDASLGKEFPPKYSATFHECKQSGERVPPSFDIFLKLDAQGKVLQMLAYPETPLANCVRPALSAGKFSPPPRADYWVSIHLEFKK